MNKNTFWGFFLIAVILIVFSFINKPSKEQLAKQQQAVANQVEAQADSLSKALQDSIDATEELQGETSLQAVEETPEQKLEKKQQQLQDEFGAFAPVVEGVDTLVTLENEVLKLTFASKGGKIAKAELKNYTAYGQKTPLVLFAGQDDEMSFVFSTINSRVIQTKDLYFNPLAVERLKNGAQQLTMRCALDEDTHLDFIYTVEPNDYMIKFSIRSKGMRNAMARNIDQLEMYWKQKITQKERGRKFEERYAQLQYMLDGGDVEKLSESKNDREDVTTKVKWIAYKDQYFSTVLIADNCFSSAQLKSEKRSAPYIKYYETSASVPFDITGAKSTDFRMYLGPNHYNTLKAYDKGVAKADRLKLKTLVPLGWKIVSWINMILVIPMFNLFTSWGMNIGIVILLMTLIIKLIILPFTFSSYRSSAKMRVLKPQIDEINAKYPPEKMQERQQATMALYRKAGVSPMSGCLPMLFQFPILMAMFWFLPTAIELRGQSFLWADDLSAYDAILQWDTPIWLIGDHLSLFCLLMTALNIVYSVINMQTQAGGQEMKVMKWMMYLMPVMFFFIFNDYAAGLSYYYLVSLIFTIIQTYIFRWSINDAKLLQQMQAKAAKNANAPKKSGFMARLEKMQREQQQRMKEQMKKQQRR